MDQSFKDWGFWRGEHTNRRRRPWYRRNMCMRTVVVGLSVRIRRRDLREICMKSSKS
ncbi:hypothetical protein GBA52_017893 [Prunus armeniaca]|nr:hypothetical protein GBA52_017893 [Prunus armeniaca]